MHNIKYYDYAESVNHSTVQQELDRYVSRETYQEGGHGLDKPIRWMIDYPICADYETAQTTIQKHDLGWYDQLAVRYYEPEPIKNKTLTALQVKVKDADEEYTRRSKEIWAEGIKAEFVSCKECGSKLSRVHIKTNRCPCCGADLRPKTTRDAIYAAEAKWRKAQRAVEDYRKQHAKKKVMWLVKIEYHT